MTTSKLQEYTGQRLRESFSAFDVLENRRPDWLITEQGERLELDFWIDELWAAVEVQGLQHVQYTPYFHESRKAFYDQVRRDNDKARLCSDYGLQLFYVYNKSDVDFVIGEIRTTRPELRQGIQADVKLEPRPKRHYDPVSSKRSRAILRAIASLNQFLITTLSRENSQERAREYQKRLAKHLKKIDKLIGTFRIVLDDDMEKFLAFSRHIQYGVTQPKIDVDKEDPKGVARQIRLRAANNLKVKAFGENLYLVSGGTKQHVVWLTDYDSENALDRLCDCRGWKTAKNNICSHVYAVHLSLQS